MLDGEGEVGIGEGFILQCEVPPFAFEGFEAVTQHGPAQQHAVGKLLGRNGATRRTLAIIALIFARFGITTEIGMAFRSSLMARRLSAAFFVNKAVGSR